MGSGSTLKSFSRRSGLLFDESPGGAESFKSGRTEEAIRGAFHAAIAALRGARPAQDVGALLEALAEGDLHAPGRLEDFADEDPRVRSSLCAVIRTASWPPMIANAASVLGRIGAEGSATALVGALERLERRAEALPSTDRDEIGFSAAVVAGAILALDPANVDAAELLRRGMADGTAVVRHHAAGVAGHAHRSAMRTEAMRILERAGEEALGPSGRDDDLFANLVPLVLRHDRSEILRRCRKVFAAAHARTCARLTATLSHVGSAEAFGVLLGALRATTHWEVELQLAIAVHPLVPEAELWAIVQGTLSSPAPSARYRAGLAVLAMAREERGKELIVGAVEHEPDDLLREMFSSMAAAVEMSDPNDPR